jgi:hypothetical protein
MSSSPLGASTSGDGVTAIGRLGFWILVADREYFVPFSDYPDFLSATPRQIFAVHLLPPTHLHWPDLDVDIELAALEQPNQFPLRWR